MKGINKNKDYILIVNKNVSYLEHDPKHSDLKAWNKFSTRFQENLYTTKFNLK